MPRERESDFAAASWESPQRPVAVPREVPNGETVTLEFEITAPAETGSNTEHSNLVEEGFAGFSDRPPGGEPQDDTIAPDIVVAGDMGDTGGGGCSIGRAPQHGSGLLLALGGIAAMSVRRRRTRRYRRPR